MRETEKQIDRQRQTETDVYTCTPMLIQIMRAHRYVYAYSLNGTKDRGRSDKSQAWIKEEGDTNHL